MKNHTLLFKLFSLAFLCALAFGTSNATQAGDAFLQDEKNTISVFKKSSAVVVNVHRIQKMVSSSFETYEIPSGMGSGFLWDNKGHIVTNYHVVGHASNIAISFKDGITTKARVIGVDPHRDIAVLQIESPKYLKMIKSLTPLVIGNSKKLQVGEKTIAIGNPFGLSRTLTTGIISALGRQVPGIGGVRIPDMIQTDASINPGNSGGPLLNSRGELIGMNTVIYSRSGNSVGIGFAVPSNAIKISVEQIIKHGHVILPGIGIRRLDDSIAEQLGIKGVIINDVLRGSPAHKAGLKGTSRDYNGQIKLGDVIIAIDSTPVNDYEDLYKALSSKKVGDVITVSFIRKNKKWSAKLKTVDILKLQQ